MHNLFTGTTLNTKQHIDKCTSYH